MTLEDRIVLFTVLVVATLLGVVLWPAAEVRDSGWPPELEVRGLPVSRGAIRLPFPEPEPAGESTRSFGGVRAFGDVGDGWPPPPGPRSDGTPLDGSCEVGRTPSRCRGGTARREP